MYVEAEEKIRELRGEEPASRLAVNVKLYPTVQRSAL